MIEVRVVAAQGATLRGPLVLRLSKEQRLSRAHVLGKPRKGLSHLDGGQEITLKRGEVFGIDAGDDRLNVALFEKIEDEAPEASETAAAGEAP